MSSATLSLIELSGAPVDRGRQHGEAAREQIEQSLRFYADAIGAATGLTWGEVTDRAKNWLAPSEAFAPDLVDEMRGIAEAAGVDLLDILALNARGEIIYDETFPSLGATIIDDEPELDGCTSFAMLSEATGDGHVYCGQNWDWKAGVLDTVVVVRVVQPPLPTVTMHIEAGQVGRQGANSAGVALNANGLGGRFNSDVGVPQTLIRRRTLDAPSLDGALSVLVRSRAHIASNALVTHRDGFAIAIETTPGAHGWLYPEDGLLVHGNHYQAPIPVQLAETYRPLAADSLYRVPRVEAGLRACRDVSDSTEVRSLVRNTMSDHLGYPESVCTHADEALPVVDRQLTLVSSCVDLTTGQYRLTLGNPCEAEYQTLPWNILDGPGGRDVTTGTVMSEAGGR